jgi:GTP-binding protein HflX
VAAFRATLEGIEEASLILHVVDSSHPHPTELVSAVNEVLAGLDLSSTPRLLVWNKIDLLPGQHAPPLLDARHEHAVAVSARTGTGVPELLARIESILGEGLVKVRVSLPYDRYDLVKLVYDQGSVATKKDGPEGVLLDALVPAALARLLEPFARDS